jgi:uncharacterized membrane protein YciS (DUF1049 family)
MINKIKPKSGWKMLYANLIKCWNTGYGAILGRFSGVLNLALLASTYLLVKGFELSFTESVIVGVGLIITILASGFLYLKYGFQKAEFSSNFSEQPEIYEMYLRIKRMEKKLDMLLPKEESVETKEFKEFFE